MDFHCHLDLYPNAREVYEEACRRNTFTWLVTTTPKAFDATTRVLGSSPTVLITPGLHPEIAHQRSGELGLLLEQMEGVKAVGEVGLDGSQRYRAGYDVQKEIFRAVLVRCEKLGGRVLSIHSRQAVRDVLRELERHPAAGTAVLHWFTGTQSELQSADAQGCWFSVGPAMFASTNGRLVAARVPKDRIVPESDGPFAKVEGKPVPPWSAPETARHLAQAWGVSDELALETLSRNSERLLKILQRTSASA